MARYNTAGRPSGASGNKTPPVTGGVAVNNPVPGSKYGWGQVFGPDTDNRSTGSAGTSQNDIGRGIPVYAGSKAGLVGEVNRVSQNAQDRVNRLQNIGYQDASALSNMGNYATGRSNALASQAFQDNGLQKMDRGSTIDALNRLRGFYQQGPGPSAAQAQLRQGEDQSLANSMALASSGRGAGDNAVAARNALFANAATQQATNAQAATLRAQEGQAWRGQQLQGMGLEQNTLGTMRAGDVAAMGQANQTGLGYGQLGLGYQTTADQTQHAYEENAAQAGLTGDQLRNQIFATQAGTDLGRYQADQSLNAASSSAGVATRGQNLALLNAGLTALGTIGGGIIAGPGGAIAGGAGANAAAQGIESSDVRAKKDIQPASFEDYIRQLDDAHDRAGRDTAPKFDLRPAQGYSYRYKDPDAPGAMPGRAFGPMAQDLEKTPAGASAVFEGPRGKMVDTSRLSLMNTAALSETQRHQDAQDDEIARLRSLLDRGHARASMDTGPTFTTNAPAYRPTGDAPPDSLARLRAMLDESQAKQAGDVGPQYAVSDENEKTDIQPSSGPSFLQKIGQGLSKWGQQQSKNYGPDLSSLGRAIRYRIDAAGNP